MVTTFEVAPSPALAPYIRRYVYREFDTNGFDIIKPWYASHEASIHFFFKALPVKLLNPGTGEILKKGKPCDVLGMSSKYNGDMYFNGAYSFFQVIFKPGGFSQLFKIPSFEIINRIISSEDIFNVEIKLLHEQLYHATSSINRAALADAFLLSLLKKRKHIYNQNAISSAIHLIVKNAGVIHVDMLARHANMSVRNFERSFHLATGMQPKLLCGITRFNHALELKLQNPKKIWTSIAQELGYFDQMHLIKDFKRYAGDTPKTFLKDTFLLEEDRILIG